MSTFKMYLLYSIPLKWARFSIELAVSLVLVPSNRCFNSIRIPTTNQYERGTHKRTYRIRSNVHSRIIFTLNSVYSKYFYNFHEKKELDLNEIVL